MTLQSVNELSSRESLLRMAHIDRRASGVVQAIKFVILGERISDGFTTEAWRFAHGSLKGLEEGRGVWGWVW